MGHNAHSVLLRGQPSSLKSAPPGAIVVVSSIKTGKPMGINHCCPCGCGAWGWIAFKEYSEEFGFPTYWERTSDDWAHLTLTPSIGFLRLKTGGYHWHGYLREGRFEEC